MKRFIAALAAFLLSLPAAAQTPVVTPLLKQIVHGSWTIAVPNVSQSFTTCEGRVSPVGCWSLVDDRGNMLSGVVRCIQNPGTATEDLYVSADGQPASVTHGFDLPAGVGQCIAWAGAISVAAASTGHQILTSELQY